MSQFKGTYEPSPRYWPFCTSYQGKVLLWGGCMKDFMKREKICFHVETFSPYLERWEQKSAMGKLPPLLYAGACSTLLENTYTFGGCDGSSFHNSLHHLNMTTMEWRELTPLNPQDGPMRKEGCGMVTCDDNTLALLGGWGIPSDTTQPGNAISRSTFYLDGRGWTNELHIYNIRKGNYIWSHFILM